MLNKKGMSIMKIYQVIKFYEGKANTACPITERLIQSGFQQKSGGYISYAKSLGLEVDYSKAMPTQWWHLIKSYCDRSDPQKNFTKQVQCGELLLWMAEAAQCVDPVELDRLVDEIIEHNIERKYANRLIRDVCFDRIVAKVESSCPY